MRTLSENVILTVPPLKCEATKENRLYKNDQLFLHSSPALIDDINDVGMGPSDLKKLILKGQSGKHFGNWCIGTLGL